MKIYPNPMMPQRGGAWPDCLGVVLLVIGFVTAASISIVFAVSQIHL